MHAFFHLWLLHGCLWLCPGACCWCSRGLFPVSCETGKTLLEHQWHVFGHGYKYLWLLWPNTGPLSPNTPLSVSFRWEDPWEGVPDLDGPLICTNVSGSRGHTRIQIDVYAVTGVLPNGLWPAEGSLLSFPQLILGCHADANKTTIGETDY